MTFTKTKLSKSFFFTLLFFFLFTCSSENFSQNQQKKVNQLIKQYLQENPEEVFTALQTALTKQQNLQKITYENLAKENFKTITNINTANIFQNELTKNKKLKDIIIVEFMDYNCSYCKSGFSLLKSLLSQEKDVSLLIRDLPILSENSKIMAKIGISLRNSGHFVKYHKNAMAHKNNMTLKELQKLLLSLDISEQQLNDIINSEEINLIIQSNLNIAKQLRLDGTPSFIVFSHDGQYVKVIKSLKINEIYVSLDEARQHLSKKEK